MTNPVCKGKSRTTLRNKRARGFHVEMQFLFLIHCNGCSGKERWHFPGRVLSAGALLQLVPEGVCVPCSGVLLGSPSPHTIFTCLVLARKWVEMETNISRIVNPAKIKYSADTDGNYMTFIIQFGFAHLSFLRERGCPSLPKSGFSSGSVPRQGEQIHVKQCGDPFPPNNSWLWILERPQTLSLLQVILITPVMIHYIMYSPKLNHSISHFLPCRHVPLYFTHGFQLVFIVAFKSYFSTVRFKTSHFIF